ncbi:MAG: PEP-CTERM sorting domain-containing protein [Limisphaerales bacterium]
MIKKTLIIAGLLVSTSLIQHASAAVIFSDDFRSYADDAALTTVWARVSGTTNTIFLAPDPNVTRGQGIEQTTLAGRLRHVVTATTPTAAVPLKYSFDFFDQGPPGTTNGGRVYAELRNSAGAAGLFAGGMYSSVNPGIYDPLKYQARNLDNGGWIQLNTSRTPGWHNFEFNIRATNVDLSIDGVVDPAFSNLSWGGGTAYDWMHLGSGLTGNSGANFDNVVLQTAPVPEPSTIAFGLIGGAGLLFGFMRRRRS